ncbi:MAG: molecular chaperone DnaK [Candidatus Omnitrophota bacterium]
MGKVIGIDLGTTNSAVAFVEGSHPTIILTQEGERLLPSMVAFSSKGERLVGNPAKSQFLTNTNTIYSVKRLMGKRYSEIKPYLGQFHYKIVEGDDDTLRIRIDDTLFSPEEISAMILEKLKEAAEQYLGDTVDGAIITVPAYFNDSQRQASKDAGEIAGLNVLRMINEPTAASLAFSLDLSRKANVVVYDFGGGTIDISILEIQNEMIKVLAVAGDIYLGGNDFDLLLSGKILSDIKRKHFLELFKDKPALQRIRDAAENAKKELSSAEECEINLPFLANSSDGPIHYSVYLKRSEFEALIEEKINRTIDICASTLKRAGLTIHEVDDVILVGGSTRIPLVQRKVKEFFKKDPNKRVNPDEIVAMGAALEGSIVMGTNRDILLLDVTPLSLGVRTYGGVFTRVIEANTTIPTNRSSVFSTVDDNQSEVEIRIFQGEQPVAEDNKFLGKFILKGIKPALKGVPRIEVTFNIDINGILKVTALDLSTQSKNEVVVSNSGLLSSHRIAEMKANTEKYKAADSRKKQIVSLKNKIFDHIYSITAILNRSPIEDQLKSQCQLLITNARDVAETEDADEMEKVKGELEEIGKRLVSPPIPVPDVKDIVKIKKDILTLVYSIEQYIANVKLDDELLVASRELAANALIEIEKDEPLILASLFKELSEMKSRLDEIAACESGVPSSPEKPSGVGNQESDSDYDTRPYIVSS